MTRTAMATSAQVLRVAKMTSIDNITGGSDTMADAIQEAEDEVTNDYNDPVKHSIWNIVSSNTKYEFRNDSKKVFRIDQVLIRGDNNSIIEYTSDSTASESGKKYVVDFDENSITFATATVQLRSGKEVEVHYIPNIIHQMVATKAALWILDQTNTANAEENTPTLALRLIQRLARLEDAYSDAMAAGSTNNRFFNRVNGEYIPQIRFVIL